MAAIALAGAWFFRRGVQPEWLSRWLPFTIAAAGVAWWIWFAPGAVGLAIAAFGAWLALAPRKDAWSVESRPGFSSAASWKG
jgi:hypothetical protein